jgi:hypothetical protein
VAVRLNVLSGGVGLRLTMAAAAIVAIWFLFQWAAA